MKYSEEEILREAKNLLRQGFPSVDEAMGAEYADSPEEAKFMLAVARKMDQLAAQGYEPEPLPPLARPKRLEDGSLRFLARSQDMIERAETALNSKAIEAWVFDNGDTAETVMGRVVEVEYVEALPYFTLRAA